MVDYLIYLFDDVADWAKWTGFIAGLVFGLLMGILGVALAARQERFDIVRHGVMHWIDFLVGAVFTLVCWTAGAAIVVFLAVSVVYATWPVSLWVILGIVAVSALAYWRFRTDPRTL